MKLIVLAILAGVLVGCDSPQRLAPGQIRTVTVQIGNRPFQLEVADSNATRQRGLMYRKSLPADAGMLFVFDHEDVLSFWMRNTYVPLDILYLDSAGKVVAIRQMKPLNETSVSSEKPAKYAIELNLGTAQQVGAKEGDVISLPNLK